MIKSILTFALALLISISAYAQEITVKGTVISATDDEPLIGASVISEKTNLGVSTDLDGNFTIIVPQGSKLSVSYVGFITKTVEALPELTIKLEENSQILEEVVVVGYQTQRKADLTGSVSVVKADDLKTTSNTDPMRALQGKVAGMTISANGSPSGTGTVRIRGIGSFNASQDPLYVIDGVPTTASLNSLNMNDIESMQVLKDAASASIYGSRAANGVIIITTKQGKKNEGKINVSFSAHAAVQFYSDQSTMKLLFSSCVTQICFNPSVDQVV